MQVDLTSTSVTLAVREYARVCEGTECLADLGDLTSEAYTIPMWEQPTTIGYLMHSFPRMDMEKLAEFILRNTGIDTQTKWRRISGDPEDMQSGDKVFAMHIDDSL